MPPPQAQKAPESRPSSSASSVHVPSHLQTLPARFQAPTDHVYTNLKKKEHPLYTTSATAYGAKVPSVHEMPMRWHGKSGRFTTGLAGLFYRNSGLNTAPDRTVVNK